MTPVSPSALRALDGDAARAAIDGVAPSHLANPRDGDDLCTVLRAVSAKRLHVAPKGGGTKLGLGCAPRALDVLLDLMGLSGVVEYNAADLTVTVRAGTRLVDLQAVLAAEGQMLALDPPHGDAATIGGIIATNAYGPHRLGYGTARDLVIGTCAARVDGTLVRAGGKVVKNVTGYDLNKLYVGSLGTLAVLYEVSFKLHPLPARRCVMTARFGDAATAMNAVTRLVRSPLRPTALVLHDADIGAGQHNTPYHLIAEFIGNVAALLRTRDDAGRILTAAGGLAVDAGEEWPAVPWTWPWSHGAASQAVRPAARLKAAVPLAATAALLDAIRRVAREHEARHRVAAFAGNGIVFIGLDHDDLAGLAAVTRELRAQARAAGGSLVIEGCAAALKALADVWGEPPSGFGVMQALKAAYDPDGLLNPGRFVGGI